MAEPPQTPRELFVQAATAIWRNRWARALILILFAFEIYNNAILPAIQGTYSIGKIRAEACSAKMKAIVDTVMPKDFDKANAKLQRECGDYLTDQ
jgi:hypothetical protein